jgi:hypothetical protein
MTDVAEERLSTDGLAAAPSDRREGAVAQSGAALFPDLVWAHFCWERRRKGPADEQCEALEEAYTAKLADFESKVGQLEEVYWSTRAASAVAMTVRRDGDDRYAQSNGAKGKTAWQRGQTKGKSWIRSLRLGEPDQVARLHRVSDWVTRDTNDVADLLQQCDLLAIKVREVLRGTTELIALRWIFGVEAHVLGFMERGPRKPDETATRQLLSVTEARAGRDRGTSTTVPRARRAGSSTSRACSSGSWSPSPSARSSACCCGSLTSGARTT